jgi:hypothetical protein
MATTNTSKGNRHGYYIILNYIIKYAQAYAVELSTPSADPQRPLRLAAAAVTLEAAAGGWVLAVEVELVVVEVEAWFRRLVVPPAFGSR